MLLVTISI